MFDVTFLIPDYPDWIEMSRVAPSDPDEIMPADEKEHLFEELCAMIDAGAFDPEREILA
ncbi:MAG: hypothetical protein ABWK53_10325 [Anaerolineales bacterium]